MSKAWCFAQVIALFNFRCGRFCVVIHTSPYRSQRAVRRAYLCPPTQRTCTTLPIAFCLSIWAHPCQLEGSAHSAPPSELRFSALPSPFYLQTFLFSSTNPPKSPKNINSSKSSISPLNFGSLAAHFRATCFKERFGCRYLRACPHLTSSCGFSLKVLSRTSDLLGHAACKFSFFLLTPTKTPQLY